MKLTISGIQKKVMPSKWGGTWTVAKIKAQETENNIYELSGYGSRFIENLKVGDVIKGYEDYRRWFSQNGVENTTTTFNKITAEYVYDLLMNLKSNQSIVKQTEIQP